MEKIASFTIDHIKLLPGLYVSRKDHIGAETVTTFDIRMTKPNGEPVMNTAEVHTIEHLAATFLRNHPQYGDKTVYFGPMGCRTGFYLLLRDVVSREQALELVRESFRFVRDFEGVIPGSQRWECGNYREHDLPGAKAVAEDMLRVLDGWTAGKMDYTA